MKKWLLAATFMFVLGLTFHQEVQAKVIWDKSEIVERQSGKMSFTKDVKIYKKMANGTFASLVAKKNDFYRVYDIEKYNGKTYYWMSSGYRVEATNLVNFKAVPMKIRASFYSNPGFILTNQDGFRLTKDIPWEGVATKFEYGATIEHWNNVYPPEYDRQLLTYDKDYLVVDRGSYQADMEIREHGRIHGTDIKVVSQQRMPAGDYVLKPGVRLHYAPLVNAKTNSTIKSNTQVTISTGARSAINGYLQVYIPSTDENGSYYYVPVHTLTK